MDKRLPGMLRILYMVPVLISVILSLVLVIQYTEYPKIEELESPTGSEAVREPVQETGVSETDDHIRRGKEILEQLKQDEQGEPDLT